MFSFHSALVSLQSLYSADSRKCKSLSPKWHSSQGPEGQYVESTNLNGSSFFCFLFFSGERAEGGDLPFPTSASNNWTTQ